VSTQRAVHWQLVVLVLGCALAIAAVVPAASASGAGVGLPVGPILAVALWAAGGPGGAFGLPAAALCGLADGTDALASGPVNGALAPLLVGLDLGISPAPCAPAGILLRPPWYPLRC